MSNELGSEFIRFIDELEPKQLNKALRLSQGAQMRAARRKVQDNIAASGVHNATALAKQSVRVARFKRGGTLGFAVSVKPKGNKGKGIYTNSKGKKKPVAMFMEEGTAPRRTKERGWRGTKSYRAARDTGRLQAYRFLHKTDQPTEDSIVQDFPKELEKQVMRAAEKAGLI